MIKSRGKEEGKKRERRGTEEGKKRERRGRDGERRGKEEAKKREIRLKSMLSILGMVCQH